MSVFPPSSSGTLRKGGIPLLPRKTGWQLFPQIDCKITGFDHVNSTKSRGFTIFQLLSSFGNPAPRIKFRYLSEMVNKEFPNWLQIRGKLLSTTRVLYFCIEGLPTVNIDRTLRNFLLLLIIIQLSPEGLASGLHIRMYSGTFGKYSRKCERPDFCDFCESVWHVIADIF